MLRAIIGAGLCLASVNAMAQESAVASGAVLYGNYCRACHGSPPAMGAQQATDPATIRAAIAMQGAMNFLGFLPDMATAEIAAYIRSVTAPPRPDYTDLWYDATQPGWSVSITHHLSTDAIFAVLYLHEPPARPLWLVMPGGRWNAGSTYTGTLYRVAGPPADRAFDARTVSARPVGDAIFTFTSAGAAMLAFTVEGVAVSRAITRQPF